MEIKGRWLDNGGSFRIEKKGPQDVREEETRRGTQKLVNSDPWWAGRGNVYRGG